MTNLRRRVAIFLRLPLRFRALTLEAYVMLALARLSVRALPFRFVARWAGRSAQPAVGEMPTAVDATAIREALDRAAVYAWWDARCLTRALAALAMIRRRGGDGTLYLGVNGPHAGKLEAHAWLKCGEQVVVGAEQMDQFHPLAFFSR